MSTQKTSSDSSYNLKPAIRSPELTPAILEIEPRKADSQPRLLPVPISVPIQLEFVFS